MNINKALIAGRLTKDPVLRTTQTGKPVASFSIATSERWKDKSGQKQEKASFHNIVLWGRLGEVSAQYLTKGQEVYVEGRIDNRKYTAKDGTEKYITEIIATNMQMGNKPKGQETPPSEELPPPAEEIAATPAGDDQDEEEISVSDVPF